MWRRYFIVGCIGMIVWLIGQNHHGYSQVREIIGSAVDISPPPPPTGCTPTSTFNLVAGTIVDTPTSTVASSTAHWLTINSSANNWLGVAYQTFTPSAGAGGVATVNLSPSSPSLIGSVTFTSGSADAIGNTFPMIDDQYATSAILHTTRQTAPCASPSCIRFYQFNTVPAVIADVTTGIAAGQGSNGGVADAGYIYFLHRNNTGTGTILYKYDRSFTLINNISIGNVVTRTMIDDGTDLIYANTTTTQIVRVNKESFGIASNTVSTGALQDPIAYNGFTGEYYVIGGTAIVRVNSVFAVTGSIAIGSDITSPGGLMFDIAANKLYHVSEALGQKRIRRIDPSTFSVEQTLTIAGPGGYVTASNFVNKSLWISDIGSPSHVQRIQLCT